jgi:hypothetical protein
MFVYFSSFGAQKSTRPFIRDQSLTDKRIIIFLSVKFFSISMQKEIDLFHSDFFSFVSIIDLISHFLSPLSLSSLSLLSLTHSLSVTYSLNDSLSLSPSLSLSISFFFNDDNYYQKN